MKQSPSYQSISFIKIISLFLLAGSISFFTLPAYTQDLYISNEQAITETGAYQYSNTAGDNKKRFWRAAAEWTMVQLIPWASNNYIRKAPFAKISFKSIGLNFEPANLAWDDNKFFNNQFSHPYQGSLYFNAFRSNGFTFLESSAAAAAGSFVWETVCETHYPAPNDLINTTLGGISFGEMSNRISRKLLSSRKGIKRTVIAAPLSFLINPVNNLNYLLDRERREKNGSVYNDETPVSMVTDAGVRLTDTKGENKPGSRQPEPFFRIHLQYGDPFTNSKEPFSNFSMMVEAGNADSAKANALQIEGCLYGRKIKQTDHSVHSFSISMGYDFIQNSSFVYGAQSFRASISSRFSASKNLQVKLKAGMGLIPLAAVSNPYMYFGEGRSYDYCMGLSFQAGAGFNIGNRLFYDLGCNAAGLKTVDGYRSNHLLINLSSTLRLVIYKNLSISASTSNYYFNGYYQKYPTAAQDFQFMHFGVGYKATF